MATREDLSKRFFEILGEWGEEFANELTEELIRKGVAGGGGTASSLAGSINYKVTKAPSIEFTMADYWEFVEYGSRPSKYKGNKHSIKKIESLIQWIKWKQIKPKTYEALKSKTLGKTKGAERNKLRDMAYDKAVKSLAYAIANSIAKKGTIKRFNYKGSKFVEDVLKVKGRQLEQRLLDEVGIEIQVELTDRLKNGNK